MRSMIMVVTRPLPVRRSVPSGSSSRRSERSPDADRDVAAGVRQLLALRPDAVRAGDRRAGRSGRPCACARTATPSCASWSEPSGLRVPSGKTNRMLPSSRIRLASRNASTSAAPRSTGWTPPLAAAQPTIGQSNSSFLPSQWIRRPSLGISHEPSTTASRFDVWLAARMSGPSRGISSMAPSIAIRLTARPKMRPPVVRSVMSGVIELSMGGGAAVVVAAGSVMRRRRSVRARRPCAPRRRGWR